MFAVTGNHANVVSELSLVRDEMYQTMLLHQNPVQDRHLSQYPHFLCLFVQAKTSSGHNPHHHHKTSLDHYTSASSQLGSYGLFLGQANPDSALTAVCFICILQTRDDDLNRLYHLRQALVPLIGIVVVVGHECLKTGRSQCWLTSIGKHLWIHTPPIPIDSSVYILHYIATDYSFNP